MSTTATKIREGIEMMEFSVKKFELLEELELTQGVVERKTTIPILSNLLFETKDDRLNITATDLELSISTGCPAKVKKEGGGTVPAKKLLELVRLLPDDDEIRFRLLDNHWIQIQSGKRNYKLVGMSKDNFPAIPEAPHAIARIPAKILSGLISRTIFAISSEESRYTLNGGLLILKPEMAGLVATDGHRLALAETEHKFSGLNTEARVLVPKKALIELQRLANDAGDDAVIEFSRDDSYLFFQLGSRKLVSRILTGQFPNYPAVLPRDNNKIVTIDHKEFNNAVRRVSQLADQRSHAVKVAVSSGTIEISAQSPEYGEATETLERDYKGEPITIGFNAQYILDFLAATPEGPIRLELKDEQSAGQLRPEGDETYEYKYVIMPMRI